MIAFAVCVADSGAFHQYCRPALAACSEPDTQLALIETDSIFSGYNEAIDAFAPHPDLEALVLLHEDVAIRDPEFCETVRASLSDPAIAVVGVIGARDVRSLCWWEGQIHGRVSETRGVLGHGGGRHDVDAVDGLLMVLSPWTVRNLRFDDERFDGFHGYDVDLCFQADAHGRRVITDDLQIHHHARGGIGDGYGFWTADRTLRHKWIELGRDMADDEEIALNRRGFDVVGR